MKIKKKSKKKEAAPKTLPPNQNDRMNFFIVIAVILVVNILIYFTAFPKFDDIAATDLKPGSASRADFFKIIVIVVTDIFLFITVSMTLSRRSAKRNK